MWFLDFWNSCGTAFFFPHSRGWLWGIWMVCHEFLYGLKIVDVQCVFHPVSTFQLKLFRITSSQQLESCCIVAVAIVAPRKVKSDAPKPPKLLKDPKAEAKAAAEEKTMELLKDTFKLGTVEVEVLGMKGDVSLCGMTWRCLDLMESEGNSFSFCPRVSHDQLPHGCRPFAVVGWH